MYYFLPALVPKQMTTDLATFAFKSIRYAVTAVFALVLSGCSYPSINAAGTTSADPIHNAAYASVGQTLELRGELRQFGPDQRGYWGIRLDDGTVWQLVFDTTNPTLKNEMLLNKKVLASGIRMPNELSRSVLLVKKLSANAL